MRSGSMVRPIRILIADDDEDQRDLCAAVFSSHGAMIIEAENGAVAVQRARSTRPDVILMDLDMPVMSGLEAIERLKEDERTRHIPVVVLSGANHDPREGEPSRR